MWEISSCTHRIEVLETHHKHKIDYPSGTALMLGKGIADGKNKNLNNIIKRNQGTRWGRDHHFSKINADNWNSMPIVTYKEVSPYITRIIYKN